MEQADIGLIGLAVMGQNLVLNMADHGFTVAVYNRTAQTTDEFVGGGAAGKSVIGCHDIETFCRSLKRPRKVMLMVKAGEVVDLFIDQVKAHLEPGDIIIDGGNSLYLDTERRVKQCTEAGLLYLGIGVSGGEEGARHGPSLMPGGNAEAWPLVKDIYQAIAAKVDGEPCCQWVGEGGAGHYVKMVHNGIEYGDMQLICEAYALLREGAGLSVDELAEVFATWNEGVLDSYLIEITRDILTVRDDDGAPLVDKIVDSAGQKGTGKWTAINALELGVPLTLIGEAVFARYLSSLGQQRGRAAELMPSTGAAFGGDAAKLVKDVHDALYASKIMSYTQGFMLMQQAATEYGWNLQYGDIALMWRGGCIIRSRFLGNIKQAFEQDAGLESLLFNDFFRLAVSDAEGGWRRAVTQAVELGVAVPAFAAALSFFDGFRSARLPANLLQAQRDYFGAHTYERIDRPRGEFFHTDWQSRLGRQS